MPRPLVTTNINSVIIKRSEETASHPARYTSPTPYLTHAKPPETRPVSGSPIPKQNANRNKQITPNKAEKLLLIHRQYYK
jgi:hypothetical protein